MLKGSILQQLETVCRHSNRPIRYGVYYKNTLVSLCHALEDHILDKREQPIVVTCFQRGKWYLQEADRYREIAACSQDVVIMATDDAGFAAHSTSQLPNVNLVELNTTDPLSQEWHLIILAPSYASMVICQELSDGDYGMQGLPTSDLERKFYGMWTFEPDLVLKTTELAIAHIENYNQELARKLNSHKQIIETQMASSEEVGVIVSRVIEYLQSSENTVTSATEKNSLSRNLVSNELQALLRMAELIEMRDIENPMAAVQIAGMAEVMAQLLDLPPWQIKRLRLAALLHRIYNLKQNKTNGEVQVLDIMPELQDIAQIIIHQNEWWNGSGVPEGLSGEEIPLESRIIALLMEFQREINQQHKSSQSMEDIFALAFSKCKQQEQTRFDPELINTLNLLVLGLQQGLDLPKFSNSMWLIDPRKS
ncbi:DICT sensory domain-containing protein [Cylindrospermopsis raciborskii]|uniref:Metal-dependent phosphohydrolase n=1 Tax=Cylindrospermopsis raciborskii CENA302 TaxID=1170768 RepID=A0A9Q5QZ47_9CYAN|nr:DICT sensory domain-containing protein [Cylindrospermopsis raciborskii]MCZ2201424.1 DICT sensory domain-containing protein [Cylindrospermopsis raciborskii PAMP2012]MCZ2205110.1 DICT sensory domain-containing protein [Cylindrospermopsis raciborskii PAMP2011]NLQ06571.1 metal-dependent phosphohydrolase [Cylindrospermopsis raciborskii MVCC19]OHY34344.1 metal-dependent phosphohydrolase [Cylindrospermopsis raciborskii MVCC14]OPH10817.1 metal-dependent phosphohydrolase [Cylindrospermopsis racibors